MEPSIAVFAFVFYIVGYAGGLSEVCYKCLPYVQ